VFKPVSLFIGTRYFAASSGNQLVSFISSLAVAGLVLGVALLIVVMSVMNGFDKELRTRILGLIPHVKLYQQAGMEDWSQHAKTIEQITGVISVAPFSTVNGLLSFRGQVQPIELQGEILISESNQQSRLQQIIGISGLQSIDKPLFLAKGIADKLGLEKGDKVRMIAPGSVNYDKQGSSARLAVFDVVGIFDTGTELDQRLAITSLAAAGELSGLGNRVEGLQITLDDIFAVRPLRYSLYDLFPNDFYSTDWTSTFGNLYQAIKMSREMVLLLVFLIIAIAAFNVISMLVMTVTDKRPAIAILKTLGCTQRDILTIFLAKGMMIGLMGCLLGALLGVLGSLYVGDLIGWIELKTGFQFLSTEVYPVDYLPSELLLSDVFTVVGVAFALNILATIYPAWRAVKVRPADELRYE
jgi:lipoprotein-releasing system permease protein